MPFESCQITVTSPFISLRAGRDCQNGCLYPRFPSSSPSHTVRPMYTGASARLRPRLSLGVLCVEEYRTTVQILNHTVA